MEILIILLALLIDVILFFIWKSVIDLNNHISKLVEEKIDSIQYQIDDVLCDINIVNENVLNNCGLLGEMKDKNENN